MTHPQVTPYAIRKIVLEQSKRAHIGHIGSSLSVADILAAIYGDLLAARAPDDPDRDRFVLSKGHAALALYATLYLRGWIDAAALHSFHTDGTALGIHPEPILPGVDFATGSLGMGLSMGVGAALAARLQGSSRRVYVLLSDAELNEGSTWEAILFAAHHRLDNLIAVVDLNGQQALGYTHDVMRIDNPLERFRAFGWDAHDVDGHDVPGMVACARSLTASQPHILVARTTFGKGVSYMENKIRWHYMPMNDAEYAQAVDEIEAANHA
ncbi:MAG: transketolase [Chloroflexota bacterium]|nr:transketolase [Chloroflexota bacterium]